MLNQRIERQRWKNPFLMFKRKLNKQWQSVYYPTIFCFTFSPEFASFFLSPTPDNNSSSAHYQFLHAFISPALVFAFIYLLQEANLYRSRLQIVSRRTFTKHRVCFLLPFYPKCLFYKTFNHLNVQLKLTLYYVNWTILQTTYLFR